MDDSPSRIERYVRYTYFRASVHTSNVLYYLKAAVAYNNLCRYNYRNIQLS